MTSELNYFDVIFYYFDIIFILSADSFSGTAFIDFFSIKLLISSKKNIAIFEKITKSMAIVSSVNNNNILRNMACNIIKSTTEELANPQMGLHKIQSASVNEEAKAIFDNDKLLTEDLVEMANESLEERTAASTASPQFEAIRAMFQKLRTEMSNRETEPPPKTTPPSSSERTGVDVDGVDWENKHSEKYDSQKVNAWQCQVRRIQTEISSRPKEERVGCGRKCIAEAYVQSFFPGLVEQERDRKVEEFKKILDSKSDERTDTQTSVPEVYGNEDFFKQTADPLRQFITAAIERALSSGELSLADNEAVQAFFEKVMMFCAVARGAIAAVANPEENPKDNDVIYKFGQVCDEGTRLEEHFDKNFSSSQVRFAQWLMGDEYPSEPADYSKKTKTIDWDTFPGSMQHTGRVAHGDLNVISIGSDIFKECMETAKRLKENPDDPKALAAFTQAMKKFTYALSQSSTFYRGQAAVLEILIDSFAKYAGFQFERPKVSEVAQTVLGKLTEQNPDRQKVTNPEVEIVSLESHRKKYEENKSEIDAVLEYMARLQALTQEYPNEEKHSDEFGALINEISSGNEGKDISQILTEEQTTKLQKITQEMATELQKFKNRMGTGYYIARAVGGDVKRENNEKFLQSLCCHPDVPALIAPNFERFAEIYPCTFVPIRRNEPLAVAE